MSVDITVVTVSWNAKYSLALLWESYQRYNQNYPAKLWVLDNGSTDGALEYAKRHADLVLLGNNTRNHGWCLTELIRRVETPYVLTMDNDAYFTQAGAIDLMMQHLTPDTLCVCPDRPSTLGKGNPYGHCHTIEWSPDVSCTLFRTEVIQSLCQHFHLGYYGDLVSERVYETSGLVWRVAKTIGMDSEELPELKDYYHHVGAMSALWILCPGYPDPSAIQKALSVKSPLPAAMAIYEGVQRELAQLRGVSPVDLDIAEPLARNVAEMIDLDWQPVEGTHVKLIPGAGRR